MNSVSLCEKDILSFSRPVWENLKELAELANLTVMCCTEIRIQAWQAWKGIIYYINIFNITAFLIIITQNGTIKF